MILFFKYVIRGFLYIQYSFYRLTGTGSFGWNQAEYIQKMDVEGSNLLKRAMVRHHVKQYHEASCSVASVVSLINAVSDVRNNLNGSPVTQLEILDKVREAHWKERMSPGGHNGKRGLPLSVLGDVVKNSFDVYALPVDVIDVVKATSKKDRIAAEKRILRLRLLEYEEQGNALIIAHFNQGVYVKALEIPHISPVGGYDPKTDMVTILDVDYEQKKNYRITFDRFYDGLSNNYKNLFRRFGFDCGGYIYIKLKESK